MNITIINDCRDENGVGRQQTRIARLFGHTPAFIGVSNELEAAGNLIDALDAADGEGIVLVNVAPRNGVAQKWENGTPFGYFWHRNTLVVSTIDGSVLSLVKKFRLTDAVRVLDTQQTTEELIKQKYLPEHLKNHIVNSQFRSFDFSPRVAAYIHNTKATIGEVMSIDIFLDAPRAVWYVDNFGNCKTTLWTEDVTFKVGSTVTTAFGDLPCYVQLKDVPHGEPALIVGSSGLEERRFLEIVVQGGSAAERFNLRCGDVVL